MDEDRWREVDDYFAGLLIASDPGLDSALAASAGAGLPAIQVSPLQGKLLWLLARLLGARRILEIGTLGGYSTIWLARGLAPGGRLVTLELAPSHPERARANLARAGVADQIEVRVGPARESLHAMGAGGEGPFDLVFIDADKAAIPDYVEQSLALARPGTLLVVDNVVRGGEILDAATTDADVRGLRAFNDLVAGHPGLEATVMQTVGTKGYDGLALALVVEPPA
jgi:predicted O-methyltransferase YrrM